MREVRKYFCSDGKKSLARLLSIVLWSIDEANKCRDGRRIKEGEQRGCRYNGDTMEQVEERDDNEGGG